MRSQVIGPHRSGRDSRPSLRERTRASQFQNTFVRDSWLMTTTAEPLLGEIDRAPGRMRIASARVDAPGPLVDDQARRLAAPPPPLEFAADK